MDVQFYVDTYRFMNIKTTEESKIARKLFGTYLNPNLEPIFLL
jgi:hypothetical protein